MRIIDTNFNLFGLDAHDATGDIDLNITVDTTEPARSLTHAVVANIRRTEEESLRVLEELTKTSDVKEPWMRYVIGY